MAEDPIAEFKAKQRETWALGNFGEVATFTTQTAGHLVRFAGVRAGQTVLDVGCGTGPVSITAARQGARVTGLDLTPELLAQARDSAPVAGIRDIVWKEGDAEALPFPDASFDVVLSQFGHMFAPRPEVAIRDMLRVLRPGGRIAFATWPPETFVGRAFMLSGKYMPPPGPGVSAPVQWGDPNIVRDRLGSGVKGLFFERGRMIIPTLSPEHFMAWQSAKIGPFIRTMAFLKKEPAKLDSYLQEYHALVAEYLADNILEHEYLLTRAAKA
ncbi:MAG TPA: class I SAM-dependent methyltransferase [Planctomycetota bacterium]|jgi:ubiquinone/menaquinone biosynthesis C-methylase UbiE|nr:class I SAM-dependent methyltransferase [Planctomycetota bacterium]